MSETALSNIAKFTGGSGFPERYQGKTSGEYPFIKVSDMNLPSNKKFIIEANNYVDTELAIDSTSKYLGRGLLFLLKLARQYC